MRQTSRPDFSDASVYTTSFSQFAGCHFLADELLCEDNYSPDCLNMIPDNSGYPEKRPGWRKICKVSSASAPYIKSIHAMEGADGNTYFLVKVQDQYVIYSADFGSVVASTGEITDGYGNSEPATAVPYGGNMYVSDGDKYRCWTGRQLYTLEDNTTIWSVRQSKIDSGEMLDIFVPTTSILRKPSGGGETYQPVNMLTGWRHNTFICDGKTQEFTLDGSIDDGTQVFVVDLETGQELRVISTVPTTGVIKLESAPADAATPGTQKIRATFCHKVDGYADIINGCRFGTLYGYDTQNRLFLSGNKQHKNVLYYSQNNNPTYFADTNYIEIGVTNYPITGFLKTLSGELAVLKQTNVSEASVWHVSAEISSGAEGDSIKGTYFPVREGVSGTGAVNHLCQQQLKNDALFLNEYGVFDLKTSYANAKYISAVVSRSRFVDYKLLHAEGLSGAFSCVWRHNYLLFLGEHVFVMTEDRNWFYWDNFPARCVCVHGDDLFFGSTDGYICRLNTDLVTDRGDLLMQAYSDGGSMIDGVLSGGKAIDARWTTRISPDGDIFRGKNLDKNGFGVYIKCYPRTSVTVSVKPLNSARRVVREASISRFDFNDIDFNAVNFTTNPTYECIVRARIRQYAALQVVMENNKINEGFGVSLCTYHFLMGKYLRR